MALLKDLLVSGNTKLVGDVYADNISGTITKAKGLDVTSAIGSANRPVYIGADGKPSAANAYSDNNSTYKMVVASTAAGTTSTATTNGNTFVNVIENGSTKVGGMKLVGTNIGITATSDGVITFSTAANPTSVATAGKASALANTTAIGGVSQPVYFGADGKPSAANAYSDNNSTYKMVVASTAAGTTSTATTNGNTFVNVIENGSTKVGGMKLVGTNIGITATSDGVITFSTAANPTSVATAGNADTVDSKHASDFATASHTHATSDVTSLTGYSYVASQTGALATSDTLNVALAKLQAQVNTKATTAQASTVASSVTSANMSKYLPLSGGTMTGSINFNFAAPAYSTQTPNFTKVATVGTKNTNTANVLVGGIVFKDSAATNLGLLRTQVAASGAYTTTQVIAYAPDTTSTATLAVVYPYSNGAPYATAPTYTNYTHSGTVVATTAWVQEAIKSNTVASASSAGNVTGVVPIANGGTGNSTAANAINALINSGCSTDTTTPTDPDYYICQYVGGGTSTTTYYRRPHSALYAYIQGKTDSRYLKLTGGTLTGNLTVTKANTATSSVEAFLTVGNNIANGTSGANTGLLRIYGTNANYINFDVGSPTRSTRLHIGDISDGLTTGTGSGIIPVYSRNTTTLASGLGSTDTPVYINSAGVIKECTRVAKALRVLSANKTIYVSNSSAGLDTNDGSTTSKPMSVAAMWKYLRETAIDKNGYTLTICFNATGTTYGNIDFHENNCPYIRTIVITTAGTISPTPSNYSSCAIFGNIGVSGNIRCTISNIASTGAITATFGAYITIKDYVRAYTFRSNYYSYLSVTGSSSGGTVLDLFNANTDCVFRADNRGYLYINSNYVVINFNGNCNYTTSIFSAQSASKMIVRWSYLKFTGTKPTIMSNFTSTLTGTVATAAGTAAKAVTLASGQTFSAANLSSGAVVYVEFNNNNTAANPTLNVNATGAKPIYSGTAAIPAAQLVKGVRYKFTYNGSQWVCDNTSATIIYRSIEMSHFTNANGTYASTYNSGTFNFSGWTNTATGCGVIDATMTGTITSATNATSATTATKWNGAAKTVATGAASGGASGDIWFQYIA